MKSLKRLLAQYTKLTYNQYTGANIGRYQFVQPGTVSEELPVPVHIKKPPYYYAYQPPCDTIGKGEIQKEFTIKAMRQTCKLAATILNKCPEIIKPGLTTDELDQFIHNEIIGANAYPSPLRYALFPKSICTSVNNVICHGIPDDRALIDGDIINVDITVFANGVHGDCSKTFLVGNVDEAGRKLVEVTKQCLDKGIDVCGPGVPMREIGNVIENHANDNGFRIVPDFIGHGIGTYFHGPPQVCHYKNKYEDVMEAGMTFTIEPILTAGNPNFEILEDDWTAVTLDHSRTAQFEHTILITPTGSEILTLPDEEAVA